MKGNVICALLLSIICLSACEKSNCSSSESLNARVSEYYGYEKNNDWESAYELRDKEFREYIPKEKYVRLMNSLNSGWELKSYKLKEVGLDGNKFRFVGEFKEKVPPSYQQQLGSDTNIMYFTEEVVWVVEDGQWFCKSCGVRYRLELNRALKRKKTSKLDYGEGEGAGG